MVFQNYALWPHMTVYKNICFGLEEKKVNKKEIIPKLKAKRLIIKKPHENSNYKIRC